MAPQPGDVVSSRHLGMKGKTSRYTWYEFPQCHQDRWLRISCIKEPRFTGLCRSCNSKNQLPPEALSKGPKHASWKGGRFHRSNNEKDYIVIWLPPDDFFFPMTFGKNGYGAYVYEHRLVMAKQLNRCLLPWEVVHHKNGIKDDNRLENLALYKDQARHIPSIRLGREIRRQQKIIEQLQQRIRQLESGRVGVAKGAEDG